MKLRLWRLGNVEERIFCTQSTVEKLENILSSIDYNKPVCDVVWNDCVNFKELSVQETEGSELDVNVVTDIHYHREEFERDLIEFVRQWKPKNPA